MLQVKKEFTLMKVGVQNIVVAVGEEADKFNGMIRLNESGYFIWNLLVEGIEKEELVKKMCSEYGVDERSAGEDADAFLKTLEEAGALQ